MFFFLLFATIYVGYLGLFLVRVFSQRKQESKDGTFSPFTPLFSPLFLSFCPLSLLFPSSFFLNIQALLYFLSTSLYYSSLSPFSRSRFCVKQRLFRFFIFCDPMSKKMKGVALDSTPPYAVGVYADAKARMKHQALLQDFQELQKETEGVRNKLEAVKQRKQMLAAEVRFLRKRHEYLLKTKFWGSSEEQQFVPPPYVASHIKSKKKEKTSCRKGATHNKLPPIPETKSKRKHIGKEIAAFPVIDLNHKQILPSKKEASRPSITPNFDLNHRGRTNSGKQTTMQNGPLAIDLNQKERIYSANDAGVRHSVVDFDLNQDSNGKALKPGRAPIFDLNEISTGDEDFQSNYESLKFDDARKGLIRGLHEEQRNDLKLSMCRNAGEGSSRVGKRKISWQDPVALRV